MTTGLTDGPKRRRMASEKPSGADRRHGLRALAAALPAIAGKAFGRRGFAEAGIITDWAAIVGPALAAESLPVKLSFPRGQRATACCRSGWPGRWRSSCSTWRRRCWSA